MQHKIRLLRLFSAKTFHGFRVCCSGIIILTFLSLQVMGCAPVQLTQYKANEFVAYKNVKFNNQLNIAVQPMTDKDEQEKYFGRVLTDQGVLAVYVIAENRSPSSSYVLSTEKISLFKIDNKQALAKATREDVADPNVGNIIGWIGMPFCLGGVTVIITLIFLSVGKSITQNALTTQSSITCNDLYTRTISPGKSVNGFVFFKLPDGKMNGKELLLSVQAAELGTPLILNFEFGL
jgi:hypothetical protein